MEDSLQGETMGNIHHDANLDPLRQKYLGGDITALIDALRYCLTFRIPLPDWAANAALEGLNGWRFDRYKTLDEAFKVQRPKNYDNTRGLSKNRYLWEVYTRVRTLHEQGSPVDQAFEAVATEYGSSSSSISRMYYEAKKLIEPFPRD